jgi:hypothetical protein
MTIPIVSPFARRLWTTSGSSRVSDSFYTDTLLAKSQGLTFGHPCARIEKVEGT